MTDLNQDTPEVAPQEPQTTPTETPPQGGVKLIGSKRTPPDRHLYPDRNHNPCFCRSVIY